MLTLASLAVPSMSAKAQDVESYKFDAGVSLGMSGYLGDANESSIFYRPGLAAAISGRYLFDTRWAIRAQLGYSSLSGSTADFDNVLPGGTQYEFSAGVYDLTVRGEFNFFAYGIGETYRRLRRWSPYLALGAGVSVSSCEGTHAAFVIPMSVGVKFKLKERINLWGEFSMSKAFTDHLDGNNLNDLYGIKSSFIKNTDWYSGITVGISFEFGPRCSTCQRID
ncbi:MAG: porin family protein [Muribaculaceae bacterium]|nr:porin family protein [Muribaculaceae bacterium]